MKSYRDERGVYHRTQAEAKASGFPWEMIDIPTDHAGLIEFVNSLAVAVPIPEPESRQWTEEEYRNGLPTHVFMKSRDPAAVFTCVICGHNNRNLTT